MIKIENLKKSFGEKEIFENLSFVLNEGEKIGLIGKNGSGKTTLLKIIIGEIEPDEGRVIIGKDEKVGYLPQTLETDFEKTIKDFFSENQKTEDWQIKKSLGKLGVYNIDLNRELKTFSSGELTKIALARLLIKEPTTLSLDEPTNNLDIEGITYLQKFLSHFKEGVLLVSHDRWILDKIATQIIDLQSTERGRIAKIYPGNFSCYKEIYQKEMEKQEALYYLQQKRIKEMKAEIQQLKQRAQKMQKSFINDKKKKSIGIMDLSKGSKIAGRAKSEERRLQKLLESKERIEKPQKEKEIKFYFGTFLERGQKALEVENLSFSFDRNNILKEINLGVYGKDRVALLGQNGSGKTTFIKILLGEIKPQKGEIKWGPSVKVGYLPQEIIFSDYQKTVLEEFERDLEIPENEARRILGRFLFSGEDQIKKLKDLSLGERRRLYLAKIVACGSNFLLLDEPTNHFDISAVEAIENALSQFEGVIFVISHDRYFLRNIGIEKFYYLKEGGFREFHSLENIEKVIK
jgi:ATPase subunit of ABC transporter with duplicated ATPase domains